MVIDLRVPGDFEETEEQPARKRMKSVVYRTQRDPETPDHSSRGSSDHGRHKDHSPGTFISAEKLRELLRIEAEQNKHSRKKF